MPTDFTQEHVDRGTDRIGLQVYPSPSEDGPVAIIWPAMGVKARYYRSFAEALGEQGFTVVVADLRGTGASTPPPSRASRYGYPEMIDDVGAVLEALKPRLDGRKRLLVGHSLGGQATLLHLALNDSSHVDGLVLVAVGLPHWRQYSGLRRYVVLPYTQVIGAVSAVAGVWPGWTFGGRQARGVIRDWAYTARTGRFPAIDGVDAEAAIREIRTPVLAVSVDHDQYTPPETLDHICAKLAAAPVRREHYTTAGAGGRLGHFAWVRASAPLASRIATFTETL
ncbi:alpha/beta fold hydrolase [Micromonospora sp. CPCC 205371]|nr:alpha/beta fold hydrolase [Micromonospora sp. CPCC 205371]